MTTDNKKYVLPCPFCGSKAFATYKTDDYDGLRKHSVHCDAQCGGKVHGQHYTEEDAITAWNSRTALKSAHIVCEPQPTDGEIIDMAVQPLGIDRDRIPYAIVVFARALLSRYAAPQASAEIRNAALEEAAEQCEDIYSWRGAFGKGLLYTNTLHACAAAIRALKSAPAGDEK